MVTEYIQAHGRLERKHLIDTCIWIDVEQDAISPAAVATVTGNEPVFLSQVTIAGF